MNDARYNEFAFQYYKIHISVQAFTTLTALQHLQGILSNNFKTASRCLAASSVHGTSSITCVVSQEAG